MIRTERLELVPATTGLLAAGLESPEALAAALGARVPDTWPPELLDAAALEFTRDRLADDPAQAGWWMYFVVQPGAGDPVLIGAAGYKGPPSTDGTVEVGYGIVSDHRRRGYASEVVRGLWFTPLPAPVSDESSRKRFRSSRLRSACSASAASSWWAKARSPG